MTRTLAALLLLVPAAAQAEPVRAHYALYARGLNAVRLDAEFDVTPQRYRVKMLFRTTGTVGAMFRGQSESVVDGRFVAGRPVPNRYFASGYFRDTPRVTQIDYAAGQPNIRQMQPPNDAERELVPPAAQAGTVDATFHSGHWSLQAVTSARGTLAAGGSAAQVERLSIFPNPVSDGALTVLLPGRAATARLRLLDSQGRVVLDRQAAIGSNGQAGLNVRGLAAGLYLLQATTTDGSSYAGKVAIE